MIVHELPAPPSPMDCCARFGDAPHRLVFDSAAEDPRSNRYSYFCADPRVVFTAFGPHTRVTSSGTTREVDTPLLEMARRCLETAQTPHITGLPPFQGGIAGFIGYEYGRVLERIPAPRITELGVPDGVLALYDWVIAWSLDSGRAWLISTGLDADGNRSEARARDRANAVMSRLGGVAIPTGSTTATQARKGLTASLSRADYLAAVARAKELIVAGDIYQVNLTVRFTTPCDVEPLELYRALRTTNAAPFAAYFEAGPVTISSASPERFLSVDESRRVEARPIKGTRPRGRSFDEDARLAAELSSSEKDRAENVMIVDLLRNDLSRVCTIGSVRVPELFAIERYATVMHLVSTVEGELAEGRTAVDLLAASFPGGSITGAPKIRAMQIIAELEPIVRGPYCGSLLFLGASGTLDSSILIRTFVHHGDQVSFGAGGGIVADSVPELEWEELQHKAEGMRRALGALAADDRAHAQPEPATTVL